MAELNDIQMLAPGEEVDVDEGDGDISYVTMPVSGLPSVRLVAGSSGTPYLEYAKPDGSDFNAATVSVLFPLLVDADAGTAHIGVFEFRDSGGNVKCALVWREVENVLQLWSAGYAGIISTTTTRRLTDDTPYWAQITVGTGSSSTARLRLYALDGTLLHDSGNQTANVGTGNHARIRIGCLERFGFGASPTLHIGPIVVTDGDQREPEPDLLGELSVFVPVADTEAAGTSSNNNQNTNFGSNPGSGAGEFGSVMERVRGLRRDNLASPLSGPPVHTGRTILRARIRRIVSLVQQPHNGRDYGLHEMTAHWEEMQATGIHRVTGVTWSGGECGEGDYVTEPFATYAAPTVVGEVIHIDVTSKVQAIVAAGGSVLDSITRLVEERGIPSQRTAHMWHTREASDPTLRPVLLVESVASGTGGRRQRNMIQLLDEMGLLD